jgi:hypothetical protein
MTRQDYFNRPNPSMRAAFVIFQRVQASGQRLTVQLARDVIAETGSDANAVAAFYQAREWLRDCERTKRLGRK